MSRPSTLTLAIAALVAALLGSCGDPQDSAQGSDQTRLARAYADLAVLSESARLGKIADTTRPYQEQADSILRRYDFTKEEFEREFRDATLDPARSRAFFDSASVYVNARRDTTAARR